MVDLLKRSLAPLTEKAWEEIDATAARVLKSQLTARRIVDFDGPHGWDFAAVNLGRLDTAKEPSPQEVPWGKRLVLPLIESRVPFQLDQMELDSIARGAKDADLEPLEDAARRTALFEESAVYNGFEPAGIGPRDQSEILDSSGAGTGRFADDPLGGTMYAVLRLEADFPIGLPEELGIRGGVFYDVGSLWGLGDANVTGGTIVGANSSFRHVIGLSILWDSAFGPLRFNFSKALKKETFDNEQSFDLTISAEF